MNQKVLELEIPKLVIPEPQTPHNSDTHASEIPSSQIYMEAFETVGRRGGRGRRRGREKGRGRENRRGRIEVDRVDKSKRKRTRSCRPRVAGNNDDYISREEYNFSDSDDKEWLNDGRGNAISTSESKDLGKIKS